MLERDEFLTISSLDFDDANVEHMATHGLSPETVWEVLTDAPLFFENEPEHPATHLMIGALRRHALNHPDHAHRQPDIRMAANHRMDQ
jgi:hypothetical protein